MLIIVVVMLVMLSMLPNATFGETLYSATTTMVAYNTSLEGREYLQEGYIDQEQWQNEFNAKAAELESTHSELLELRDYLSEDNQAIVDNFNLDSFKYISELEETNGQFAAMRDEALPAKERQLEHQRQQRAAQQQQQQAAQQQNYSGNNNSFKSQGVIYQNGIRYTYYSSNVLYHYRTPEWTAGSDGIYRDNTGYIVVASSDHSQGSVVSTPFGAGKVYDSGCASGTIDIYTNF